MRSRPDAASCACTTIFQVLLDQMASRLVFLCSRFLRCLKLKLISLSKDEIT